MNNYDYFEGDSVDRHAPRVEPSVDRTKYRLYCNRCGEEVAGNASWVTVTDFYPSKRLNPEEMDELHRYIKPLCKKCAEKVDVFVMPMKREDAGFPDYWDSKASVREAILEDMITSVGKEKQ